MFSERSHRHLGADARAGANVALLAFPQSIAYSLIAGVPPQFGVLSGAIGGLFGPLFSGSRFIILGPTNATAIMVFAGFAAAGVPEEQRLAALPLFILLVGIFQILGSIARLSVLLAYISRTVVTGYITAAAALIGANQIQNVLGFHVAGESTFFGVLAVTMRMIPETQLPEVTMGAATLVCHLLLKRFFPKLPGVAVTLVLMAGLTVGFSHFGWELRRVAAFSLDELRLFQVHIDAGLVGQLSLPAMALAFVAVLEGTSVGKTLASRSGSRLNINQEIYGMGATNVVSSFLGGLDTSGSLTRSALSHESGARTAMATIFSGLFVLIMLFTFGFLLGYIPRSALAVEVMIIAASLFNRHHLHVALRTTGSDAITFIVTCGAALLLTLDAAIYLGAATSVVLFLRKAGVPELVEYNFNEAGQLAESSSRESTGTPGISILHAEGDLFFGSTEIFVDHARQVTNDPDLRVIILRLKNARHLDATAILAIEELLDFLRQSGRDLIISGANTGMRHAFANAGLLDKLGRENFFPKVLGNPNLSTRHALLRAQEILGRKTADIRIFVDATRKARERETEG